MKTRFMCAECGKLTAGRLPREGRHRPGDGTARFPRRHKDKSGKACPGNTVEAEWIDVDDKGEPLDPSLRRLQ